MNESNKTRSEIHSPSCYDDRINILPGTLRISKIPFVVISGFRHEVAENRAPLGHYAASSGNVFTDVSGHSIGPILRVQEFFSRPMGAIGFPELPLLDQTYCHFHHTCQTTVLTDLFG
jgi:hypothetical protein